MAEVDNDDIESLDLGSKSESGSSASAAGPVQLSTVATRTGVMTAMLMTCLGGRGRGAGPTAYERLTNAKFMAKDSGGGPRKTRYISHRHIPERVAHRSSKREPCNAAELASNGTSRSQLSPMSFTLGRIPPIVRLFSLALPIPSVTGGSQISTPLCLPIHTEPFCSLCCPPGTARITKSHPSV